MVPVTRMCTPRNTGRYFAHRLMYGYMLTPKCKKPGCVALGELKNVDLKDSPVKTRAVLLILKQCGSLLRCGKK